MRSAGGAAYGTGILLTKSSIGDAAVRIAAAAGERCCCVHTSSSRRHQRTRTGEVLTATWTGRRYLDRPPLPGPAAATWTGLRQLDRPLLPGPVGANWTSRCYLDIPR